MITIASKVFEENYVKTYDTQEYSQNEVLPKEIIETLQPQSYISMFSFTCYIQLLIL